MPFDNAQRPGPGRGTGERAINLPPAVLWLDGGLAFVCGSPTLILGGVFLWLGSRRLKR